MNEDDDSFAVIASRADFHAAIRHAFTVAAEAGAREIFLVDADFADWPLNDRAVIEALAGWADSRRLLTVMASRFDEFPRRHMRFSEWRRQWSHVVRCRSDDEIEAVQMPTLMLVSDAACVRLPDRVRYRGSVSTRPRDQTECREAIDALLQRSAEAFPITTLGL